MTQTGATVVIESWPFQYGKGSYDRNEILQDCAVQLAADAKDYAGDNQEHLDILALANERNDGQGFDSPLGYPNDGPNSRLKPDDFL